MIHGKLVRDNIPSIIRAAGQSPYVIKLTQREFSIALVEKLKEEVDEFTNVVAASKRSDFDGQAADEIADMLEVICCIMYDMGLDQNDVEQRRVKKLAEKGGFDNRTYLVRVRDAG